MAIKLSGKGCDFEATDDWDQIYPDELKHIGAPLLSSEEGLVAAPPGARFTLYPLLRNHPRLPAPVR